MILGICAKAGSGKDTVAEYLGKKPGVVTVALADVMKRFCQTLFEFTDRQLWGPSNERNEPDLRYPSEWMYPTDPDQHAFQAYLSPRYALQRLGTEFGRECYEDVWVDFMLRVAYRLFSGGWRYTPQQGLIEDPEQDQVEHVIIPDIRFLNEAERVKETGGALLHIVRPGAGLRGESARHPSETEQDDIPTSMFAYTLMNTGTIENLYEEADLFYNRVIPQLRRS